VLGALGWVPICARDLLTTLAGCFWIGFRSSIADMGDNLNGSRPKNPPLDINKRTSFGRLGCTAYGYPSSGGILIKVVDVIDMQFLQLDRFSAAQRSSNLVQEDELCARMRKIGAISWAAGVV